MPGNRVDELEATVQELEATVSGLSEELVAVRKRLRELESDDDETEDVETSFDDAIIVR